MLQEAQALIPLTFCGTMVKLIIPQQLNSSLFLNKDSFLKHEMQHKRQHYIKWKIEGFVTVLWGLGGEKGKDAVVHRGLKQKYCSQTEDKSTDKKMPELLILNLLLFAFLYADLEIKTW